MSNGNVDNSAPLEGVLKVQITRPKQRGLEPKRTSPRWVITAISRSTTHPGRLVMEKSSAHTAGPLGSTQPLPSGTCCGLNYQNVCTLQDRWHVPWSKPAEERDAHSRQGSRSSQKGNQALMRASRWLGVTSQEQPSQKEAWSDEITASLVEGRTNWELLTFQLCQTQVNNQQGHGYLHHHWPLHPRCAGIHTGSTVITLLNPASYCGRGVQPQGHISFFCLFVFLSDAQAVGPHSSSSNIWEPQRLDNWKLV